MRALNRARTVLAVVALIAVILAMGACSGSIRGLRSGPSDAATPTEDNPHKVVLSEKTGASRKSTASQAQSPPAVFTPNAEGKYEFYDFVDVQVPEHISWEGPTCAPPTRGSACSVPFYGQAFSNEDNVQILLLAFENGSDRRAAELAIPGKKGVTKVDHWLPYVVGPDAEYVSFKAVLVTSGGKVLAENKPYIVPIWYK